jgi:hypothetical protein
MRSRNAIFIGIAADWAWDGADETCRLIPIRRVGLGRAVLFNQLGEVDTRAKVFRHGRRIGIEAVGCNLESPLYSPS